MIKPDDWTVGCVRMALLAARLEGLSVVLREDGATVVRGGMPSSALQGLLTSYREGIAWVLHNRDMANKAVRRAELTQCSAREDF
jgi:hypothetical protein